MMKQAIHRVQSKFADRPTHRKSFRLGQLTIILSDRRPQMCKRNKSHQKDARPLQTHIFCFLSYLNHGQLQSIFNNRRSLFQKRNNSRRKDSRRPHMRIFPFPIIRRNKCLPSKSNTIPDQKILPRWNRVKSMWKRAQIPRIQNQSQQNEGKSKSYSLIEPIMFSANWINHTISSIFLWVLG